MQEIETKKFLKPSKKSQNVKTESIGFLFSIIQQHENVIEENSPKNCAQKAKRKHFVWLKRFKRKMPMDFPNQNRKLLF